MNRPADVPMNLCPKCADARGRRPSLGAPSPLAIRYQREKQAKHTAVDPRHAVQSVFDSNSTQYYADCIEEALRFGAVQVGSGYTNAIYCPSVQSRIGMKHRWGGLAEETDTVVVVRTDNPNRVHAFTEASSQYSSLCCSECGEPIIRRLGR